MKKVLIATVCLAAGIAAGCSSSDNATTTAPTPTPTAEVAMTEPTPVPTPSIVRTETKSHTDGSEITINHHSDNSKHEHRVFKSGPLHSVTRKTHSDGTVTAHVVHRDDNTEVEVKDKNWVEKSMDATGDALAKAAGKTKDFGEKVGETTEKDAKMVGGKIKDGAEKVGDEVKKDVKGVGHGIKKIAEKTKKAVTN
ncbi:MAG: hypothetical protein AB7H86_13695 [Blastocatellales bacterium]